MTTQEAFGGDLQFFGIALGDILAAAVANPDRQGTAESIETASFPRIRKSGRAKEAIEELWILTVSELGLAVL